MAVATRITDNDGILIKVNKNKKSMNKNKQQW